MNNELIKEALIYDVSSDLHEIWRATRKLADGSYNPRYKKSKDEEWNIKYGTDEVDIANLPFKELPFNCKYDYLEEAEVVINLVFDKTMSDDKFSPKDIEDMETIIHNEWLKRNDWVFDKEYGNPTLAVPYNQLPEDEQLKDKAQIGPALAKIEDYKKGLVDIDSICSQYNITAGKFIR